MNVDVVLIAGPTASGKSAAALALAERINGALINADSMQVYGEARILTARPDDAETARAPHFLYGHVSVRERYDAARFATEATDALALVRAQGRVPIFVGGTGLYFQALVVGLPDMPRVAQSVRDAVARHRERIGAIAFHDELRTRDPESATRLKPSDSQRVLRAYEVFEATGTPLSQWQKGKARPVLGGEKTARFVLSPPREELRRRIDARFDAMLAAGALDEVKRISVLDAAPSAAKILGLRELSAAGDRSLDDAVRLAKTATRQYAKRQMTWFRHRMKDWTWIEATQIDAIMSEMVEFLRRERSERGRGTAGGGGGSE